MIDLSGSAREPYAHQRVGVEWLVDSVRPEEGRLLPGGLFLADEMRLGKTKQVIDAATVLWKRGEVRRVIVVCPAPVRDVWFDPELGELAKHRWPKCGIHAVSYHARRQEWTAGPDNRLQWVITNYEYIRHGIEYRRGRWRGPNLDPLLDACDESTVLVLDESIEVKNHRALQHRACLVLRKKCGRVWLLNGTPIGHSPEDLFGQAYVMDWRILGFQYKSAFMARYAVMGGYMVQTKWGKKPTQVLRWKEMDELQMKLAPYVLRRVRKDCLDLPPKLDPVTLTVPLGREAWRTYRELREEFITWLETGETVSAAQAGVRAMRLAQVCAGFLGGLEPDPGEDEETGDLVTREVGREKLDLLLEWISNRLREEPSLRMLVWCRFRPEARRIYRAVSERFPQVHTELLIGGQTRAERTEAVRLMHPEVLEAGPGMLVGTVHTGKFGLNFAGAHEVVYSSNDWSLHVRSQSEDRPHGPGQTHPVSYHDLVTTGPAGEPTMDSLVLRALRGRRDLASQTVEYWQRVLREEGV